jgi:hypothetical protein
MVNGGADSGLAQGVVPDVIKTIHTSADTSVKVNGEAMTRVLRFVHALVTAVAQR